MTAASGGSLATLGITPNKPATGYGYIEANMSAHIPYPVIEFVEKPAKRSAKLSPVVIIFGTAAFFYSPAVPISRN
jgi:mannose-1-phosphate guanylyltransferase